MRIAVIAWGSLIWCPRSLQISSRWHEDGPCLPIEFARISMDGRLTLVINGDSPTQQTYWASHLGQTLDEVRQDLKRRERAGSLNLIHHLSRNGETGVNIPEQTRAIIMRWLSDHQDVDACVWTGFGSNWRQKFGRDFAVDDAIDYIGGLINREHADSEIVVRTREYIEHAPAQIQTPVRSRLRELFGWADASLPMVLFEPGHVGL